MKTTEIRITQEDVNMDIGSESNFISNTDCPLARAIKRARITDKPHVGTYSIAVDNANNIIGEISPRFEYNDYALLKEGVIKEFVTIFTPIKP